MKRGEAQTGFVAANALEKQPNQWGAAKRDICKRPGNFALKKARNGPANGKAWQKKDDPAAAGAVCDDETNEIANEKGKCGKMIGNHEKCGSFVSPLKANAVFG